MARNSAGKKYKIKPNLSLFTDKDKDYLTEQLSVLLGSGMDMSAVLESVAEEMKSAHMKSVVMVIKQMVEGGTPLWQALNDTNAMPPHFISLIKIGEKSGTLAENLKIVSTQHQKDKMFRSKVSAAIVYPAFVLVVSLVVGLATSLFVLPRISSVVGNMGMELPALTRYLITAGEFIRDHGIVAIPSALGGILVISYLLFGFGPTRFIGDSMLMMIPGVGELLRQVEMSRLGNVLGRLLKAGVPVVDALDLLQNLTRLKPYKRLYAFLKKNVEAGNSFRQSFMSYRGLKRLIPLSFQRLIVAAEQAGTLSDSLSKVGEIYEEKTDITSRNIASMLEPILLVIVWLGVAAIAIGVVLPIYSTIGNFGSSNIQDNPPTTTNVEQSDQTYTATGQLTINDTGEAFVEVFSAPDGDVTGNVYPGETYDYLLVSGGWYQIGNQGAVLGWVSADAVTVVP